MIWTAEEVYCIGSYLYQYRHCKSQLEEWEDQTTLIRTVIPVISVCMVFSFSDFDADSITVRGGEW